MKKLLSLLSSACAANCSFTTILTEKPSFDLSLNPVKIICSFLLIRFSMNTLCSVSATLADIAYTLFSGRRHCLLGGLKLLESLSAFCLYVV